jgi:hypothetical protein
MDDVFDVFDVLDCALRSGYLAPEALPTTQLWSRLPEELRSSLADAFVTRKRLDTALVWQVRRALLGKPASDESGERTRTTAALLLGLLYLMYRDGRLEAAELLTRAGRVADSYVCDVAPRPFFRLRAELATGGSDEGRVAALFSPYLERAEQCIRQWGLQ